MLILITRITLVCDLFWGPGAIIMLVTTHVPVLYLCAYNNDLLHEAPHKHCPVLMLFHLRQPGTVVPISIKLDLTNLSGAVGNNGPS